MRKVFVYLSSAMLLLSSCRKDEVLFSNNVNRTNSEILLQHSVIGEKQPNPLEMANAIAAFNKLSPETKNGYTVDDIKATHKYIAFTPTNEDEYYALNEIDETKVVLSSYPLDYEVSDGLIVPDNRFVINGFSYKWAYVPIDFDLTGIECPYIYYYDIFSPYEDIAAKSDNRLPMSLIEAIEKKSYEICGIELQSIVETKASKFIPCGRIRFYDKDCSQYRGVEGLSIRTVRGTHSSYTHCDAGGSFTSSDSFKHAFRYEIHFSRTDFVIRKNDTTDEIIIKYSNYKGPIFKDLNDNESTFYAVLSRAAIVYYYGDNSGLRRPPMRNDKTARLAIQARLGDDPNAFGLFSVNNRWILSNRPKIQIYRDSDSKRRDNMDIYATTIHELAHSSHWRDNQKRFNETDNSVIESFARGVQWILTSKVYPGYNVPFYYRQSYSGIVQDLIDGYGIKSSYYFATWVDNKLTRTDAYKSYNDQVEGFTPSQIEEAVRKSRTWNEWAYNIIKMKPAKESESDISAAFTYWNSSY